MAAPGYTLDSIFRRAIFPLQIPLNDVHFSLDTAGVAGVFGGDEAISAMATAHVYQHRKFLGWYNTPGSYEIAKRYGRLARSNFFDGLFPGVHTDPAMLFELDGSRGPKFRAAHSGTLIDETGHLASLIMKECAYLSGVPLEGRKTQPIGVTIVELNHVPESRMSPPSLRMCAPVYAMIPILISFVTCAACAVFGDWYSFGLILLGIMANGISCLVIGSGEFIFTHPSPAPGSPAGDGILISDREVVLLKGPEGAVNSITRGRFALHFESEPYYRNIGWCSVLLMFQFIAQLLLIPQGRLFGQLMFVVSLAVSWGYNLSLSALDKECIQRQILMNVLHKPRLTKYTLGTRTSMVVFALLALAPENPRKLLDDLLPNDTKVWRVWKSAVASCLMDGKPLDLHASAYDDGTLMKQEVTLLETLFGDAAAAYRGFTKFQNQGRG